MSKQRPRKRRTRGWWLFKEQWSSICSRHYEYNPNCHLCNAGDWTNVPALWFSSLVFKLCPSLWRWWVNRPNSAARKRLKKLFPNL